MIRLATPPDVLSFIVQLGLGAHPILKSAQAFGTLFPATASSAIDIVPVRSWTVISEIHTAVLLSADVSPYVGRAHHSWTFSLLSPPTTTQVDVAEQHCNFVICIPADAIPIHDSRFPFMDGDLVLFYVDESGVLPQLRPIPTAHLASVSNALHTSGFFLHGIEHLNCGACEDGEGVVLVKYDIG